MSDNYGSGICDYMINLLVLFLAWGIPNSAQCLLFLALHPKTTPRVRAEGFMGQYEVLGTEPGLAVCKANTLTCCTIAPAQKIFS